MAQEEGIQAQAPENVEKDTLEAEEIVRQVNEGRQVATAPPSGAHDQHVLECGA